MPKFESTLVWTFQDVVYCLPALHSGNRLLIRRFAARSHVTCLMQQQKKEMRCNLNNTRDGNKTRKIAVSQCWFAHKTNILRFGMSAKSGTKKKKKCFRSNDYTHTNFLSYTNHINSHSMLWYIFLKDSVWLSSVVCLMKVTLWAICPLASFYYFDQNAPRFFFHI